MESSNGTLLAAAPAELSVDMAEYPVNDAGRWMQNRLDGTIHPALNTDTDGLAYDNDKEKFALLADNEPFNLANIYKQADVQKRAFIATVNRYNAIAKESGSAPMDITADYTWSNVLSAQKDFLEERQNLTTGGVSGFMYKTLRKLGDNSETLQSWLKLLPTESHYLSVLCGGLTLILGAAKQMSEIRENVQNFIDDLPLRLSKANEYINIFKESPALHQCSADLYEAILSTLDDVVQAYHKHAARKTQHRCCSIDGGDGSIAGRFGSAILKQKRSGKALQDKIRHVQECADKLVVQANICSMQSQKSLLDEGKDLKRLVVRSTRKQDRDFTTVFLRQDELMEAVRSQDERIQSQQTLLEGQADLLNQLMETLKATSLQRYRGPPRLMHLECEDLIDGYQTPRGRSPSPGAGQDRSRSRQRLGDLLEALSSNCVTDTAEEDASILLNVIGNLSFGSQDRAAALIMSPILQQWLTSTVSSPLIVNGQMYSSEEETRQSPLSYFCAKLVDSILPPKMTMRSAESRGIFAVKWFCGQHTNFYDYGPGMSDYDAHPPGMLSNMLGQLIVQLFRHPVLPQLDQISVIRKDPPLSELCSLFTSLVEALPTGSILFIVIDGISYYEDEDRREECMEVLSMLTNMTRGDPGFIHGCLTKLLVTAPLRSHCVQDLFEDTEILNLDEYIAPNGGFTASQWDMGIGRVVTDE